MNRAVEKLELNLILAQAAQCAVSEPAKSAVLALLPCNQLERVRLLLDETAEADICLSKFSVQPEFSFDSIKEVSEKSRVLSTLTMAELLRVMRMLRVSRNVKAVLTQPLSVDLQLLRGLATQIFVDKKLEEDIDLSIESESMVSDKASSKLYSVRQSIRRANEEIKAKLNNFIKGAEYRNFLQDAFVTVRDGRFVVPVKAEYRGNVPGLVHDVSGSGSTVFIEPMPVVNLNNEIKMLLIDEAREIERILAEFTGRVNLIYDKLLLNEEIVVKLDVIFARAHYALKLRAVRPKVNASGFIDIKQGRHPLLDKNKVVPVSISLGRKFNFLVITGPNTGGKTVSLKTVGLFVLMAGCGLFLPCREESEISLFDNIFCDIGDEQSIAQNLSTFSGHMKNICSILSNVTHKSLVLLDELGAGTEPNEGAALALSITEYLLAKNAKGLITTHYSELKEFSLVNGNIENASMEFDLKTFAPTYKLVIGVPGSSNAIRIAQRLGLPEEVTSGALGKLSKDKVSFENVLASAEKLRQEYESKMDEINRMRKDLSEELIKAQNQNEILADERESLLKNSKTSAKRIVSETKDEAQQLIEELKQVIKENSLNDKAVFAARAKVKKFTDKKIGDEEVELLDITRPVDINSLKAGDRVYFKPFSAESTVVSAVNSKGEVEILAGKIKVYATADNLAEIIFKREKPKTKSVSDIKFDTSAARRDYSAEINVIGKNSAEALADIDVFLDNSIMAGVNEVRIVHGFGAGILRKAVHSCLKSHPAVSEYRAGGQGEGGAGVTVARFK